MKNEIILEIPAVTISYHSTKLGVSIFLIKENTLFCLIGF